MYVLRCSKGVVLDANTVHRHLLQVIPKKYADADISELDRYFAMGRGRQRDGVDLPAQEMQKWFDSNYHCKSIVEHRDFFRPFQAGAWAPALRSKTADRPPVFRPQQT